MYPLYYIEAKALCRYALKNLGKKRIAIAYQNDDYGKNGVEGAEEELASHGLKLVAEVPVEKSDTDMKSHVMKLKNAKADVVLLWVTPIHAVRIVGTGRALRFAPQWPDVSAFMALVLIGFWALATGILKGIEALRLPKEAAGRWALGWGGGVSVLLGVVIFAVRPGEGVLAMSRQIGLCGLVLGAFLILLGLKARGKDANGAAGQLSTQ